MRCSKRPTSTTCSPFLTGPADRMANRRSTTIPAASATPTFFAKIYGDCREGEVSASMKDVRWVDGSSVEVSNVNGLADRLQRVADELAELPDSFDQFLVPSAGTYNCRTIAGTDRMSMHAFAAAIDISTATTDYWLWNEPVDGRYPYRNQVPFEIVGDLRAVRLHLGRQVVSLRHHAFRIPPRAISGGGRHAGRILIRTVPRQVRALLGRGPFNLSLRRGEKLSRSLRRCCRRDCRHRSRAPRSPIRPHRRCGDRNRRRRPLRRSSR